MRGHVLPFLFAVNQSQDTHRHWTYGMRSQHMVQAIGKPVQATTTATDLHTDCGKARGRAWTGVGMDPAMVLTRAHLIGRVWLHRLCEIWNLKLQPVLRHLPLPPTLRFSMMGLLFLLSPLAVGKGKIASKYRREMLTLCWNWVCVFVCAWVYI